MLVRRFSRSASAFSLAYHSGVNTSASDAGRGGWLMAVLRLPDADLAVAVVILRTEAGWPVGCVGSAVAASSDCTRSGRNATVGCIAQFESVRDTASKQRHLMKCLS